MTQRREMPSTDHIIIATRGSALALAQANLILDVCRAAVPHCEFELQIVKTTGDRLQAESSAEVDLPKGLFTKELEVALLNEEADLAVHSLKDLPTELPERLALGAITVREDVRDVFIYRTSAGLNLKSITDLPERFVVATSSPRREHQLKFRNPGVQAVPIRGNVPTRLRKLATQREIDGLLLAAAGLKRLGYSFGGDGELHGSGVPAGLSFFVAPLDDILPCVGQGALGIEVRAGDTRTAAICHALNHAETECCALAERAFLRAMGGGCQTPVAAFAELAGDDIRLRAVSFEHDQPRRTDLRASRRDCDKLGNEAAVILKKS